MNVLNPHAAGTRVGSRSRMVAVDQDPAQAAPLAGWNGWFVQHATECFRNGHEPRLRDSEELGNYHP